MTRLEIFGHDGPYTLDELQAAAWTLAAWAPLPGLVYGPGSAIIKTWLLDKTLGTAVTPELDTTDGYVAVILATGKILHWLGGDLVEVV